MNDYHSINELHEARLLDPQEQDVDCSDVRIFKVEGSIAVDVKVNGFRRAFAVREFDGHFLAGDTPALMAFFAQQAEDVETELNPGSESFTELVRNAVRCNCPRCTLQGNGGPLSSLLSAILGDAKPSDNANQEKADEPFEVEFVRTYFAIKTCEQLGRVHGCTDACGELLGHLVTCCNDEVDDTVPLETTEQTSTETAAANTDTVSDQV